MTPDFIKVGPEWTIRQVLDHIRAHGRDSETLNVVYVTDAQGRLIDDVRIREFLLRPLDTTVDDIHDSSFVALHATDPESEALEAFKKPKETRSAQADSAAYAIAALGGKITASNKAAEFGSVGVVATYVRYEGVNIYEITSSNAPPKSAIFPAYEQPCTAIFVGSTFSSSLSCTMPSMRRLMPHDHAA